MKDFKPTIAIDFDGVIHAYTKGWQDGEIYDEANDGTREALEDLSRRYELTVFTARENLEPVRRWLQDRYPDIRFADVTNKKPKAKLYIDDRAVHFTGWESTLETVRELEERPSLKWSPYASDGKLIVG